MNSSEVSPGCNPSSREGELGETEARAEVSLEALDTQPLTEEEKAHQLLLRPCFVANGRLELNGYDIINLLRSSHVPVFEIHEMDRVGMHDQDEVVYLATLEQWDDNERAWSRLPSRVNMELNTNTSEGEIPASILSDWIKVYVIGLGLSQTEPVYRIDRIYDITRWLVYHEVYEIRDWPAGLGSVDEGE